MASAKEAEAAPLHRDLHLADNGRPISASGAGQDYSHTPMYKGAAGGDQSHSWLVRKMPFLSTRRGKIITVVVILVVIGGGLAGLAALRKKDDGQGNLSMGSGYESDTITDDGYFYGQSPGVYPSPNMTGLGIWSEPYRKAQDLVGKMTLKEKISLTSGVSSKTGCVGFIPPISRLNFTGLCLHDAGNGLRNADFVSSWPSGIHVGASWNKKLASERGRGMGGEFRTKGVNILLGPVVGPAGRVVHGGRNWEGFSVDPYLAGSLVSETVTAIQGVGVITSTKHFIANEQETNRNPVDDLSKSLQSVSSNIDDRTMHELYLWPFQDAVRTGTGNIMCSYQRVNNSYGCANSKTLNGLLKTELGFQGFVVSDWGAQHAGVATALSGMDMTMPNEGLWGSQLETAVTNGSVPESRITDMVTRIIASWYQAGQDIDFPSPGIGMAPDLNKPHKIVDARNSTFRSTLLAGAVEGHVLVKNANKTLPFQKPKLLSLFGYSAKNPDVNTPGSPSWTFGVSSSNFTEFQEAFMLNHPVSLDSVLAQSPIAINGTIYSGGGSGATSQGLTISPFDAIVAQAYEDGTALQWDFVSSTPNVNPMSDACLVFGNAWATEGLDRPSLTDDYTDGIILHVAERCASTVVLFHNAGTRLVDAFIDHPNVTAVIFAHLPGELSGQALGRILWGLENPSGKLPYTVAKNESDYSVLGPVYSYDNNDSDEGGMFSLFPQSNFTEGVWVDYRWFDQKGIEPRYEFGFGLSYTTFGFGALGVEKQANGSFGEFAKGEVVQGGREDLWDVLVKVTAEVTNKGDVDGMEVAQVYVSLPSSSENSGKGEKADDGAAPVRQLRGFEKVVVGKGETVGVEFELTRRDLSVWDVEKQGWRLDRGSYGVFVGASSRDLPLKGQFKI